MCFSAEASFGVAAVLLPVGGYCLAEAWRKDRGYLPFAAAPVLFGLQQLCEGVVWMGTDRGEPESARPASLAFLFFALALWPVWIPLAAAAVEPRGWPRRVRVALAGFGALFGVAYYLPVAADRAWGVGPVVIGHSLRYDLTIIPAVGSPVWWIWPTAYLAVVLVPLLTARDHRLRSLGAATAAAAAVSYVLFEYAFASVWCFFASVVSMDLVYVLRRLPVPNVYAPESGGNGFSVPSPSPPA